MLNLTSIHDVPAIGPEDLRRREIYRYLRLEGNAPDDATSADVERNLKRLEGTISLRHVASLRPVTKEDDAILFGDFSTSSAVLQKNMKTSEYALLFAMTLGPAVDRLISRLLITSKADAFITDACCTEYLESYANRYCAHVREEAAQQGFIAHPRFSPGFADFGLEFQWPLIRSLQADKKMHIALTEGNMLVPTKTITALMGLDRRIV
ncbi:MAG: hypothetical protein KH322_03465 [Peptoniphilaceae bacterium]|nr:hypothetical protein [Peptoniphilaceae bacterium]